MSSIHQFNLETTEALYIKALINADIKTIETLTHPKACFATESGHLYIGAKELYSNYLWIIELDSIEIIERSEIYHNNHVVVFTKEIRIGNLHGVNLQSDYNVTRIWHCLPKKCIVLSSAVVNCHERLLKSRF